MAWVAPPCLSVSDTTRTGSNCDEEGVRDFALDATACAVRDVAADVLSRHEAEWSATFGKPTFGKQADAHADDHDGKLWQALVDAGLLALALPESAGGDDPVSSVWLRCCARTGAAAAVTPAIGAIAAELTLRSADPDTAHGSPRPRIRFLVFGGSLRAGRRTRLCGPLRISSTASSPA